MNAAEGVKGVDGVAGVLLLEPVARGEDATAAVGRCGINDGAMLVKLALL